MTTTNTLDTNKSSIINLFKFEGQEVRVLDVNGAPWWVLADVCGVLEISQPHHAANRLDEDEKDRAIVTTLGGPQEMAIINESGLWSLVLTSRKAAAKRFKKWVTAEVIPSIRKTGSYSVKPLVPQTYAEALLEAGRIAKERDALKAENLELAPKAAGLAILAEKDGELGIRDAGRELKVGQNRVRDMLFDRKWACRQGRGIRPASYGLEHGYVRLVPRLYEDKRTGQEKISDDFRITRKGIARLAEIFGVMEAGRVPFAKAKEPTPA